MQALLDMGTDFSRTLSVFLISMVPVVELRGAIPVAAGLGFPWYKAYLLCVAGNLVPIPFVILFARAILKWLRRFEFFKRPLSWLDRKIEKNKNKVLRYSALGLLVFVMLPLPGTGAWTGAIVASVLDMRLKSALPSIIAGVFIAGLIMTAVSYGILSLIGFAK